MDNQLIRQREFFSGLNYASFLSLDLEGPSISSIEFFQRIIYDYFEKWGRVFSWRRTTNPYRIVVSEIMLQQTQTSRVEGKFEKFIEVLPSFDALAQAELSEVLFLWQGLGYNRRAKALHATAKRIVQYHGGALPRDEKKLQAFPGIGQATAASICAFAFNMPTVFIETNIRTVFLHFFFRKRVSSVKDAEMMPLVGKMLDKNNARIWYYALTDCGVGLKRLYPELNKKSAHYARQSKFEGSDRQIRGNILKLLLTKKFLTPEQLAHTLGEEEKRVFSIVNQLVKEGFLEKRGNRIALAK